MKKVCPVCNKEFETNRSYKKYCCVECKIKNYLTVKRNKNLAKRNIAIICPMCGKPFFPLHRQKRYCSKECKAIYKKKMNDFYNEQRKTKKLCKWCGERLENTRLLFCSKTCGDRYNQAKGRTGMAMSKAEYEQYRTHKCAVCGVMFVPKRQAREGSVICETCAKKYHKKQHEIPNMCSICGKVIRDSKALCKDCYEKATWRYDVKMVDFKGVKVYE